MPFNPYEFGVLYDLLDRPATPLKPERRDPWDFWGRIILLVMVATCFTGFLVTSAMFFNRWISLIRAGLS